MINFDIYAWVKVSIAPSHLFHYCNYQVTKITFCRLANDTNLELKRKFLYELRGTVKSVPRCIWEIESLHEDYFVLQVSNVARLE